MSKYEFQSEHQKRVDKIYSLYKTRDKAIKIIKSSDYYKEWDIQNKIESTFYQFCYDFLEPYSRVDYPSREIKGAIKKFLINLKENK